VNIVAKFDVGLKLHTNLSAPDVDIAIHLGTNLRIDEKLSGATVKITTVLLPEWYFQAELSETMVNITIYLAE